MERKPVVAIYREHLLPASETFVRAQAEALRRYAAVYVGHRKLPAGLELPAERTVLLNRGGPGGVAAELLYHRTGIAPAFVSRVAAREPALVHAHFGPDGVLALPLARRLRVPLIVTLHGYDATVDDEHLSASFASARRYARNRAALLRQGRLFLAVSRFIRAKLVERGFPPDRVVAHYIGLDAGEFRPDPRVARRASVLFVGRLVENKGCEFLIRAMAAVQRQLPETELVLIGDGPLRAPLERLAGQTLRHARFLGVQPPAVVRQWMNAAAVFSVPSVTIGSGASEGLGMVFLEAQAMQLPVASFATGGIPEAVADGATALLARERDWEGLARHIVLLLRDEPLRARLGAAGRARVCADFDLARQTRLLEDLYDGAVEAHARESTSIPSAVSSGRRITDRRAARTPRRATAAGHSP